MGISKDVAVREVLVREGREATLVPMGKEHSGTGFKGKHKAH